MSIRPGDEVPPATTRDGAIETVIIPHTKDLGGGFNVRRALPAPRRRMVGPFIFWDEFGPARFDAGQGLDVRPHPHINLATITYLFEGEIYHRDTLGSAQAIKPGDVNWMNAGRGIAHSERTTPELRASGSPIGGIQSWIALPEAHEESDPFFVHHDEAELPTLDEGGKRVRVIAGKLYGKASPVKTFSDMFYADVRLDAGATLPLDADYEDRAIYTISGEIEIAGDVFGPNQLLVFRPGDAHQCESQHARAFHGARRRAARRASHLVEFCLVAQRAHRASEGRLESRPLRHGAG